MTVPTSALPQSDARVLVAVICCAGTEGRCTVRDVADLADLAGYSSVSYTHLVLRRLRARGLVAWEDGTRGSLRPLVRPLKV